jgi:hypothetical protein
VRVHVLEFATDSDEALFTAIIAFAINVNRGGLTAVSTSTYIVSWYNESWSGDSD